MLDYNVSRSYGAVIIKETAKYNTWKYFYYDQVVDQRVADTLCREMGFTHAMMNTITGLNVSEYVYGYQYQLNFM